MSASAENSRGHATPLLKNPQNTEQWNQMLEHIRQHHEDQISQLVETVRSYGLAIARNPDGTFTVNTDDDANPFPGHANCHRMPRSLSDGTANGPSVPRPMTQLVSQPSQPDISQKYRIPQPFAADQPNGSQLQRSNKPQQLYLNQELHMGLFITSNPQSGPVLQSGKGQFSTSQPLQFSTRQQFGPGLQSGKGQFSTSQSQLFGKPKQFSPGLQTDKGQFSTSQPPQFSSFQQFCMGQPASSTSQAPRFGVGQLPSASSQGLLAPMIPQASCLPHPLGSAPATPQSQPSPHFPCSFPLSQNLHELYNRALKPGCLENKYPTSTSHVCSFLPATGFPEAPYESRHPRSFGSHSYASGLTYAMPNDGGYSHALSAWDDKTVIPPNRVLPTMVPFTKANNLSTQAISPYQPQVPKELDTTHSPDTGVDGYFKTAQARGSTAGPNASQRHKRANNRKKTSGVNDNIQKERLRRHKHFYDFEMPMSEVFNYLMEQGLLQPMENYQPRNPKATLNTAKHCAFHRYYGHTTDNCKPLGKAIRRLIENGKIKLPIGQDAMNNPLPNNTGVNMTEFGDSSIVNVIDFGPPLGCMDSLVSEASHQPASEPLSNCTSCIRWGSYEN